MQADCQQRHVIGPQCPHASPTPPDTTPTYRGYRSTDAMVLLVRLGYPGRSTAARLQVPLLTAHLGPSDVG